MFKFNSRMNIVLVNSCHSNSKYQKIGSQTQLLYHEKTRRSTFYVTCIMLGISLYTILLNLHNNHWEGIVFIILTCQDSNTDLSPIQRLSLHIPTS